MPRNQWWIQCPPIDSKPLYTRPSSLVWHKSLSDAAPSPPFPSHTHALSTLHRFTMLKRSSTICSAHPAQNDSKYGLIASLRLSGALGRDLVHFGVASHFTCKSIGIVLFYIILHAFLFLSRRESIAMYTRIALTRLIDYSYFTFEWHRFDSVIKCEQRIGAASFPIDSRSKHRCESM